jgi:hypothetical protein
MHRGENTGLRAALLLPHEMLKRWSHEPLAFPL